MSILSVPLPSALVLPKITTAVWVIVVLPLRLLAPDNTKALELPPLPLMVKFALPVMAPEMVAVAVVLVFCRLAFPVSETLLLGDNTRSVG